MSKNSLYQTPHFGIGVEIEKNFRVEHNVIFYQHKYGIDTAFIPYYAIIINANPDDLTKARMYPVIIGTKDDIFRTEADGGVITQLHLKMHDVDAGVLLQELENNGCGYDVKLDANLSCNFKVTGCTEIIIGNREDITNTGIEVTDNVFPFGIPPTIDYITHWVPPGRHVHANSPFKFYGFNLKNMDFKLSPAIYFLKTRLGYWSLYKFVRVVQSDVKVEDI